MPKKTRKTPRKAVAAPPAPEKAPVLTSTYAAIRPRLRTGDLVIIGDEIGLVIREAGTDSIVWWSVRHAIMAMSSTDGLIIRQLSYPSFTTARSMSQLGAVRHREHASGVDLVVACYCTLGLLDWPTKGGKVLVDIEGAYSIAAFRESGQLPLINSAKLGPEIHITKGE